LGRFFREAERIGWMSCYSLTVPLTHTLPLYEWGWGWGWGGAGAGFSTKEDEVNI